LVVVVVVTRSSLCSHKQSLCQQARIAAKYLLLIMIYDGKYDDKYDDDVDNDDK